MPPCRKNSTGADSMIGSDAAERELHTVEGVAKEADAPERRCVSARNSARL